ncbi:MAG: hypothetical protein IPM42_17285 [Saprospiraceae bacterium]|nr:hypothetical protein [Saprospiraceae bacterium]
MTVYGLDATIKSQSVFAPNDHALFQFRLNNVPAGMYIAVIQQSDLIKTAKFIIK